MRFRLLLVTLGAVLVALTFTFPFWLQLLQSEQPTAPQEIFPGLSAQMQEMFLSLPPDQQAAYRAAAEEDRDQAVAMIEAALSPGLSAPEDQAEMPALTGGQSIATGAFTNLDSIRWAQGNVTIYQQVDESKVLRFEDFSIVNGPGLRVALAVTNEQAVAQMAGDQDPVEFMLANSLDLGQLLGINGNQNYEIAPEVSITPYDSIIIYSPTLEMIYSIAPLTM
jgi:hypothetical protein